MTTKSPVSTVLRPDARSWRRVAQLALRCLLGAAVVGAVFSSAGELTSSDLEAVEELPHPQEIALMEELAAWTGDTPTSTPEQPFPGADSMFSAVEQYPESFAAFRKVVGPEGRAAVLGDLPYGTQIRRAAERHGVDPLLVAAIVFAESSFQSAAVSPVGALGLMQLMPATALALGAISEDELTADPTRNLDLGARYISKLMRRYGGDVPLVLAAYNSGPGNVRKFGGIPPFAETRNYVEKVLTRYVDLQNAAYRAEILQMAEAATEVAAGS